MKKHVLAIMAAASLMSAEAAAGTVVTGPSGVVITGPSGTVVAGPSGVVTSDGEVRKLHPGQGYYHKRHGKWAPKHHNKKLGYYDWSEWDHVYVDQGVNTQTHHYSSQYRSHITTD